ncbi:MAG: O-methyltransferase [Persicimonas sp.]
MSPKTLNIDDDLHKYIMQVSVREAQPFVDLRAETAEMAESMMQTAPEQGQLLQLLVKLTGARRAVEVGTFTGYSAMCIAAALPDDGELIACDVNEEWVGIGRPYWEQAGVADKIEVRIQPALDTLDALLVAGEAAAFDFAYIDADKTNYQGYFERCLELLRAGGLVAVDNTLWSGKVADESVTDDDTVALREFNAQLAADERVDISLVTIGDGLTLARKR